MDPQIERCVKEYHAAWRRITGRAPRKPEPDTARRRDSRAHLRGDSGRPKAWAEMPRAAKYEAVYATVARLYRDGEVVRPGEVAAALGLRVQNTCKWLDSLQRDARWRWRRIRDL